MSNSPQVWSHRSLDVQAHDALLAIIAVEAFLGQDRTSTLRLKTDYSQRCTGQLKARIETFRERERIQQR